MLRSSPNRESEPEGDHISEVNLSSNENPLGPSPKAMEAVMAHLKGMHRYPDKDGAHLKERLAKRLGVRPENIILGSGSCEILDFAARTCLETAHEAIIGSPSFFPYQSVVERAHGTKVVIPLKDFNYDLDEMIQRISKRTRLIIIGNPNNPTGTTLGRSELDRFIDKVPEEVLVILDEAYHEYVRRKDFPTSLDYVVQERHVMVLRSLSKVYGLAGLRIGYGIAAPAVIRRLDTARQHFNTSSLAQVAAAAAIEDGEHLQRSLECNASGMRYLREQFDALNLFYVPSEANFILVKAGDGSEVYRRLKERGVMVAPMDRFQLPGFIRVTIGLPEENQRFIRALRSIQAESLA